MRTEVKVEGLAQAVALLSGAEKEIRKRWRRAVFGMGAKAVGIIRREYRGAGETTATATAVRTGRLRAAYSHQLRTAGTDLELDVGVIKTGADAEPLKYAAIHEFGGVINAKPGGFLAIPLAGAMTGRGVSRGTPRSFPNTFAKWGVIIQKQAGGELLPLFALKRSVTIPARPALLPALMRVLPELGITLRDETINAVEASV